MVGRVAHRESYRPTFTAFPTPMNLLFRFAVCLCIACATPAMHGQSLFDAASYDALKQQGLLPTDAMIIDLVHRPRTAAPQGSKGGGANECDCWFEPDSAYIDAIGPSDDGSSAELQLPFTFTLFGDTFMSVFINNNGNVSFGGASGAFSSAGFPSTNFTMVAPFWADVDTRPTNGGHVWYRITPSAMYINWDSVGYFSMQTDKTNSFQLILTNGNDPVIGVGNNTSFCYRNMEWTTGNSSGGTAGFGGTPATSGVNNGNGIDYFQVGRFGTPLNEYLGTTDTSGVRWLNGKSFRFDLSPAPGNTPPVHAGTLLCNTLFACVGETDTLEFFFASPEADQNTFVTVQAPTLSNFSQPNIGIGLLAYAQVVFTTALVDVGTHTLTATGTDDDMPSASTIYTFTVVVEAPGAAGTDGQLMLCANDAPSTLLDALGGSPYPFGTWYAPGGALFGPGSASVDPSVDVSGTYLYVVTGSGCADDTATVLVTVDPCMGVAQHAQGSFHATWQQDGIWITSDRPFDPATRILVLDGAGRQLIVVQGNGSQVIHIDATELAAGLYVVRTAHADGQRAARVIVP